MFSPGLLHLHLATSKFLRIFNCNSYKKVILELSSYCILLENISLMPSQRNKLHNSNYEERKTEQKQNHIMPLCKSATCLWFGYCVRF